MANAYTPGSAATGLPTVGARPAAPVSSNPDGELLLNGSGVGVYTPPNADGSPIELTGTDNGSIPPA